jgi:hypothetical protein
MKNRDGIIFGFALMAMASCTQPEPPTNADHETDAPTEVSAANTAPKPSITLDFSPIGLASCDEFIEFARQCFQNAKVSPSVVALLQPSYEAQFKQWRALQAEPNYQKLLGTLCEQQLANKQQFVDGLRCE